MSHFTGYGAYVVFVTIRTHFESPTFDFFKHHKVRATRQTYEGRSDRWLFDTVAREYRDKELRDFFIANRLQDRKYVTELLEDEAVQNYNDYMRRKQALTYVFSNELDRVFRYGITKPFALKEGEYPYIISLYLRRVISPETMVILSDHLPFFEKFDKYLGKNDVIWSKVSLKISKYKPFLRYDREKFKRILKEKVDENTKR